MTRLEFLKRRYNYLNRDVKTFLKEKERLEYEAERINIQLSNVNSIITTLEQRMWETVSLIGEENDNAKDGKIIE